MTKIKYNIYCIEMLSYIYQWLNHLFYSLSKTSIMCLNLYGGVSDDEDYYNYDRNSDIEQQ